MIKTMLFVLIFSATLILGGCTNTTNSSRISLDIDIPSGVELQSLSWTPVRQNGVLYYGLTQKDFEKLDENLAIIQQDLDTKTLLLKEYKAYYEKQK